MKFEELWILQHANEDGEPTGELVLPRDRNPDHDDQGTVAYQSKEAAAAQALYLLDEHDIYCVPVRVTLP